MNKTIKSSVLFFGIIMMLTGCQEKKNSTTDNVSNANVSKTSKESDKNSSSEKNNDKSSSKPKIEEISAEDFETKLKDKDAEGEIVFFKTPGSKESDNGLRKFSKKCQKIDKKLYVVDMTTETGKRVVEKYNRIGKPYDAIIIKSGAPLFLDLQTYPNIPIKELEGFANMEIKK